MDALDSIAEEWLSYLQVEKGASVHTVTNYRRDIEGYIQALHQRGVTDLKAVTPDNVADYLSTLSHPHGKTAPKAPSSIARALAAIRGFHRFAIREKYGAVDPTQDVHSPQMGERLPKALSIDEVTRLLDMAARDDSARGIRDHALLEVLYATGARVSEALAMAVDDIDLDEELPVVRLFGKGRKERLVPVGHAARQAVGNYLVRARPELASRGRGDSHLFLNLRGRPMSRQSAWESIQRVAREAGLESKVSPHTLRHSFATHLLEGGASVRDVQELLGHASVQTTQIYTRLTATTLREVYRSAHPRAQLRN